jgi:2-methylcitrate dehydratase PrpD
MPNALIHHQPHNELQAKFSMEFCIAILLLERKAGLAQFTDEVVNRDDVQEVIGLVDFDVDPQAEAAGYNKMTTRITVELRDGRTLTTSAAFGKGSPQNPMTDDELIEKFLSCLEWGGFDRAIGKDLARRVMTLEQLDSIDSIIGLLS